MIPRRPLALAILLAAGAALAQTGADDGAVPTPAPGQDIPAAEKKAPATAGANNTPARSDKSPSDYQASEQISEDLPVSFPADI
jgi:hypothetical protein